LRNFDECFGRREPVGHLRTYVEGQMSDLPRKSVEPMAKAAGVEPRCLQQFLSRYQWDHLRVRDLLQQRVARAHAHPGSIGLIDESGHVKKGAETPGVQRQWCGRVGKVENCIVTVHLGYAAGDDFHCLLDSDLFLPQEWSDDRERCRDAGLPDEVVHRPKWRIALELRDRAVANGVVFHWLTFDEGYPQNPEFLFALDDRGQHYVGEVKRTFTGWLALPALLYKRKPGAKGPTGRFPRLQKQAPAPITFENMMRYSPQVRAIPWEKFYIKDTEKGPAVWEAKAVPVYLQREGLPTRPHWLIIARNIENPEEIKFFLSNAPAGTPLEVLLHVAFSRWHIERCFQDEKTELGLSHFEGRSYQGLLRHLILTSLTHLFLAEVYQTLGGKKKSGPDGLPGPHRQFGLGPLPVDGRTAKREVSGTSRSRHHRDPSREPAGAALPSQGQTQMVAQARRQNIGTKMLHLKILTNQKL
jgi:SRSO17 transposase